MMALAQKFIIFFVLLHLVKTEQNRNDPIIFKISPTRITRIPGNNVTIRSTSTIPSFVHHQISLEFSNVGLRRIGPNFITSNDIVKLNLNNNEISDISPLAFRNIQYLSYLDISGNRIPKDKLLLLEENGRLQILIIDNNIDNSNTTAKASKEYKFFKSLKYLHLSNSQLWDFMWPLHSATPVLTHLYLSNNNINSSSAIFDNIPATLIYLYLDRNLIDRVEQGKLRYLREFNLNNNLITQVCFRTCKEKSISLSGAVEMKNLFLSKNLISDVSPDAFNDMENLSILDLSSNKIGEIASGTFNHTGQLTNLSLADNKLITIPDMNKLWNLKILNLTGNLISEIPTGIFNRYSKLEYLYLSNNAIITIKSSTFYLQSLRYLDLSGNQLKQLPFSWIVSHNIRELHLERNNFTKLDDVSLNNINTLSNVYLDGNPMQTIKIESVKLLSSNMMMHLKNMGNENKCLCQSMKNNDEDDYTDDYNNNSSD